MHFGYLINTLVWNVEGIQSPLRVVHIPVVLEQSDPSWPS